jgi:hypothetical protein
LVAALTGMKNKMEFVWIGWPGAEFPQEEQQQLADQLWKEEKSIPVFISNELADLYYNGNLSPHYSLKSSLLFSPPSPSPSSSSPSSFSLFF